MKRVVALRAGRRTASRTAELRNALRWHRRVRAPDCW
jgi:hypothetical protein